MIFAIPFHFLIVFSGFTGLVGRLPLLRSAGAETSERRGVRANVALAGILFVATLLRLYDLNAGLWHDEIMTYVLYAPRPFAELVLVFDSQNQHILYSLLAHACFLLFGESAWALRLPAVLFGVASLWALYLLGCELNNRREALLATLLLTVSYHHIWFSQNARGYTGLLFWTLFSSWFFVRALRTGSRRQWIFYALAAAAGAYVHLTMAFTIVGQGLIYLIHLIRTRSAWTRQGWTGLWAGFGLTGLLIVLLYAPVLPQMFSSTLHEVSLVESWISPLWALAETLSGLATGLSSIGLVFLVLLLFLVGLVGINRIDPLLVQLFVIPALICAVVVIGLGHHLWPRFFFFIVGFAALITVRGAMIAGEIIAGLLARWRALSPERLGTVLSLSIIAVSLLSVPFVYGPKQDFAGAWTYLNTHTDSQDRVVTAGLATFTYQNLYRSGWAAVESAEELEAVRSATSGDTWLVYTLPMHMEAVHPDIVEVLQREFTVEQQFAGTLGGGTVYVLSDRGSSQGVQSSSQPDPAQ